MKNPDDFTPQTVTVRVAVAVDPAGKWCANGWHGAKDRELMDCSIDAVEDGEARYFLTVELPIPQSVTKEVPASDVSVRRDESIEAK